MELPITQTRRWLILGLLFAAGLINYLDRAILSVSLPAIAADLGLGPTAKGVLLSAFFWSYALMQLPMGWLSDRLNLRWLYAAAFALWSISCGATGFAGTLSALIALRICLGVGEAIYLPGGIKILRMLFDSAQRGLASGVFNSGTRAGLAFGAPFIAWLVVRFTWPYAFFFIGFFSLLWLVPWLLVYPARTQAPPVRDASGRSFHPDRSLLGLCLGHFGYGYYWYLLVTWLPDYLVEARHFPLQKAGAYAMVPYLIYTASEPLGGWIADKLMRLGWSELRSRKIVLTAAFLASVLLLPAGRVASDANAVLLLAGASLVGLASGNVLALLQHAAPEPELGLWTGIMNFIGNLAGVAAPLVTGVLIARTGSFLPAFAVAAGVLLSVLPAYWLLVGGKQPAAREAAEAR